MSTVYLLQPNPNFVKAIRRDGYKEYSSDVFETKDETSKYYFIQDAIILTNINMLNLENHKSKNSSHYNKYKNTIDYLLKYYEFLLKENISDSIQSIGASYNGGIVEDYITAVNSKKSILYTTNGLSEKERKSLINWNGKWPKEMNSWAPLKFLVDNYVNKQYAPLLQIGGAKQQPKQWYFNLILISAYQNQGFEDNAKKIFMNWNGNPLNNKKD